MLAFYLQAWYVCSDVYVFGLITRWLFAVHAQKNLKIIRFA